MKNNRLIAVLVIVVGALICAWQLYEVGHTKHLTFWIVGCIPLPIILLGIVLLLGGLLRLFSGRR
jgi:hypothetical protein